MFKTSNMAERKKTHKHTEFDLKRHYTYKKSKKWIV